MLLRASFAASKAGIASSRAFEASASSYAMMTDCTSRNAFFSAATSICLLATSDFCLMSSMSSSTTFFFSAISAFLTAKSCDRISVSSYALARVVRPPSRRLICESMNFRLFPRNLM